MPNVMRSAIVLTMKLGLESRRAIRHTIHCLVGCGLGEVTGMLIASLLGWHRVGRLSLAILLAFTFGYSLTYRGVRKYAASVSEAIKITVTTDTVSIATMEVVDTTIELLIPNVLIVTATSFRFWWGLVLSIAIAFCVTVPVNRYMIARNPHAHQHHV
jgi:hypothetical protein